MTDMDKQTYQLNLNAIANCEEFLDLTRRLAVKLMDRPYITVSEFLHETSDEDLQDMLEIFNDLTETNEEVERMEEMVLIAEMLAFGEGLDGPSDEVSHTRTNQLMIFVVIESLKRKGLVNVHYENMSFGEDFNDKVIAEKP